MSDIVEPGGVVVERLSSEVVPARAPVAPVPSPPPSAPPATDAADGSVMSLVDHLSELRKRLALSILAVLVGGFVGFLVARDIVLLLTGPLPEIAGQTYKVQFLTVSGPFLLYMKISIVVGILLALPVILYELWAFVAPGLTPKERRSALPWIPMAVVFFILGVGVAYVTLPYALGFLTSWTIAGTTAFLPSAEAYFGFVTLIFLVFGAVMEFPIVLVLLSKLGILSVDRLKSSRRIVILGIVIFAVVVTPGGDPISPLVMAGVMYPLYELTIFLLSRSGRTGNAQG